MISAILKKLKEWIHSEKFIICSKIIQDKTIHTTTIATMNWMCHIQFLNLYLIPKKTNIRGNIVLHLLLKLIKNHQYD